MHGPGVDLRPLLVEDIAEADAVAGRAFGALEAALGRAPGEPRSPALEAAALGRIRHLVSTDPEGAWAAERDGRVVGVALALLREGVWGLSLLVVDPPLQAAGVGHALIGRALAYGADARGGLILSSEDPRAMRLYARAGFALHPVIDAAGAPRPVAPPRTEVRPGGPGDQALTETVDRVTRGAAHGADIAAMVDQGHVLLVAPDRGYVVVRDGAVRLLSALDEATAQDLLRAALATVADGASATVEWVGAAQQWAIPVLLEAGLTLRTGGAVFRRGETGTFTPYLPSGAYL